MATKMSKAMYGKTMMKKGGTKKSLRKAQDGIEMNNDDMINKSGSKGSYKKPMKIVRSASSVDGMYGDTTPGKIAFPDVSLPDKVQKRPTGYKTGGMVNANANLKATATAGSKGVKVKVNPKAAASKVAKGRVGGTSVAPKKAIPKAKYGMSMKGKKSC